MENKLCIIQFMHPGVEQVPEKESKNFWNTKTHKRKFLVQKGKYLKDGNISSDTLVFWGEWEPQSELVETFENSKTDEPKYLYKPFYKDAHNGIQKQNTDPFVFGDQFYYSNCKQLTKNGPTQMKYLQKGSLILFGSCISKQSFVVDTVFVVSGSFEFDTKNISEIKKKVSKEFYDVTLAQLQENNGCLTKKTGCLKANKLRLYTGATYENPVGGMFSFFPCLAYQQGVKFPRPQIKIPDVITDNLTQGKKKIEIKNNPEKIKEVWDEVVKQVVSQNLYLGVFAEMPKEV